MRRFWPVFAVPLAALAITALVGIVRRDSVSATPGQVVEDFLRRLIHDRYPKAADLLVAGGAEASIPDLERWKKTVENGLGEVTRVRGETEWISGEEAEATGILVAEHRERRLRFALERADGRWRIARLDEFWGEQDSPQSAADPTLRIRERWRLGARSARNR